MSGSRLASGGCVDRTRPLRFTFDGRAYTGHAGDTLASALLANGVSVVGRSFKLHRPRGLLAAGVEEPNALMQVGEGAWSTANLRATEVELYEGLVARAVNCWPSAAFDVGAVLRPFERFLTAGFYYKTFMWPDWHLFEGHIRRAAGLGRPSTEPDPSRYETRYAHCDVLVIGGGPAGLVAAVNAAAEGQRVIVCEQEPRFGGRLLWDSCTVEGKTLAGISASGWIDEQLAALEAAGTTALPRTTAAGYWDHNALTLVERVSDHLGPNAPTHLPRQRLWQVRAGRVVVATGALERPLVFPGNDCPGVMLATAVRRYLGEYGTRAGDRLVVFTNNDDAYATAQAFAATGGEVVAIVDSRATSAAAVAARAAGFTVHTDAVVYGTSGRPALRSVKVRVGPEGGAKTRTLNLSADVLAMSGGHSPTVHLFSQSGGKLEWDASHAQFRPGAAVQAVYAVGDAAGVDTPMTPLWTVRGRGKAFIDFMHDVTATDIELSAQENFRSVEHLKRYTTLGMAPDQGKTSNINALAHMGEVTGRTPDAVGTTRYRFPYTPVAMGVLGGRQRNELFRPLRRLALHDWHTANGGALEEYGGWMRAAYYLRPGEDPHAAEQREALAVRQGVGIFDGSPLGKIEVSGPDAAWFLDRFYCNTVSTLKVGKLRYGLMLNELGVVIDDGVVARLAEDRFLVGTTTSGATRIAGLMEEWLQCEWVNARVLVAPITTSIAVITLTGPKARAVVEAVGVDFPCDATAFPHMSFRDGHFGGVPARVCRVSFTGEVSYEINVANSAVAGLWQRCMEAGAAHGIAPIGIEAWMLLRTEKGYLHIGADTDGTTSPQDIGWSQVLKRDVDFIGRRSLTRTANLAPDRYQLVGLEPVDGAELRPGRHLRGATVSSGSEGYITSGVYSATLGRWVGMAMVRGGHARSGEVLEVVTGGKPFKARIAPLCAYDLQGDRLRD